MQYLRRSLKYLLYFVVIFAVIVGILWALILRKQGYGLTEVLQPGSGPKLILFFLAVAAIYPYLNFRTRKLYFNGDFEEKRDLILGAMTDMGYELMEEKDKVLSFRLKSAGARFSRLYEDAIVLNVSDNPLQITGYRRDIDRIMRNIDFKIRESEADQA